MDYSEDATPEENIARGLFAISAQLKWLGNGDAGTNMGAIENLAREVRDSGENIAAAIESQAEAINNCAAAFTEIGQYIGSLNKHIDSGLQSIASSLEKLEAR